MEQKEQIDQIEQNISELVESEKHNSESDIPEQPNSDGDHIAAAEQAATDWTPTPEKRGPGRPWGRKNKPKHVRGVSEYLENSATEDERRHWERGTAIVTVDQLNTYINMAGGMSI